MAGAIILRFIARIMRFVACFFTVKIIQLIQMVTSQAIASLEDKKIFLSCPISTIAVSFVFNS